MQDNSTKMDQVNEKLEVFLQSLLDPDQNMMEFPDIGNGLRFDDSMIGIICNLEVYIRYLVGQQYGRMYVPSQFYSGDIKAGSFPLFDERTPGDEYEHVFIPTYFVLCSLIVVSIFEPYVQLQLNRRIQQLNNAISDAINFVVWYFGGKRRDPRLRYLIPIMRQFFIVYRKGTVVNKRVEKALEKLVAAMAVNILSGKSGDNNRDKYSEIERAFDEMYDKEFGGIIDTAILHQDTVLCREIKKSFNESQDLPEDEQ